MTDTPVELDPLAELEAMKAVHAALAPLSPEARGRVAAWAVGALEIASVAAAATGRRPTDGTTDRGATPAGDEGATPEGSGGGRFKDFADLLGDASPSSDADKALVGGYWLQVINGVEDFTSQAVNDRLKDTGEPIGNITRAFDQLKSRKPQLVRQLLKQGKSQQARKKFKLTTAGIQAVERMVREEP